MKTQASWWQKPLKSKLPNIQVWSLIKAGPYKHGWDLVVFSVSLLTDWASNTINLLTTRTIYDNLGKCSVTFQEASVQANKLVHNHFRCTVSINGCHILSVSMGVILSVSMGIMQSVSMGVIYCQYQRVSCAVSINGCQWVSCTVSINGCHILSVSMGVIYCQYQWVSCNVVIDGCHVLSVCTSWDGPLSRLAWTEWIWLD